MPDHPSLSMKPDRRTALFTTATAEFTERGFEAASLNRIIQSVSMSKSSFYHYFDSKTDLFEQILRQTLAPFAEMAGAFDPATLSADNFWPSLLLASDAATELLHKSPEIIAVGRMFYRNLDAKNPVCVAMMSGPVALTTRILERGRDVGVIRSDLPTSLLLESVMALGTTLDRWALENHAGFSDGEMQKFNALALDMFVRFLGP